MLVLCSHLNSNRNSQCAAPSTGNQNASWSPEVSRQGVETSQQGLGCCGRAAPSSPAVASSASHSPTAARPYSTIQCAVAAGYLLAHWHCAACKDQGPTPTMGCIDTISNNVNTQFAKLGWDVWGKKNNMQLGVVCVGQ